MVRGVVGLGVRGAGAAGGEGDESDGDESRRWEAEGGNLHALQNNGRGR